ncbi:MAG: DUF1667 domain-containing protein [Clostridiaceae bacterium]|jgi:CxxC motif-containing protein|nr:DUF1667 domain-containing protein [Clostridiaceae bacterium]
MRQMTCLVCPVSCLLEIRQEGDQFLVQGNLCPKGRDFALREMTRPMRTLSSTVKTDSPHQPVLPVKLSGPLPKDRIMAVMDAIRQVRVQAPLDRGQVLISNVLGLGVDLVASTSLAREDREP